MLYYSSEFISWYQFVVQGEILQVRWLIKGGDARKSRGVAEDHLDGYGGRCASYRVGRPVPCGLYRESNYNYFIWPLSKWEICHMARFNYVASVYYDGIFCTYDGYQHDHLRFVQSTSVKNFLRSIWKLIFGKLKVSRIVLEGINDWTTRSCNFQVASFRNFLPWKVRGFIRL